MGLGWVGWVVVGWDGGGDRRMGPILFLPCNNDRTIKKGPMNDCWPVLCTVLYTEEMDELLLLTWA